MEGFIGDEEVFVVSPGLNGEPVELDEDRGDVIG